jgi:hypothetical protein
MAEQKVKVKYIRTEADFKGAGENNQHIYYSPLFYIIEKLGPGTEINLWQQRNIPRPGLLGLNPRWLGIILPDKNNEKNRGITISVEVQFLQTGDITREQFAEVANIITAYKYPPHRELLIPGKYFISVTVQPKKKAKKPKPKPTEEIKIKEEKDAPTA